MFALTGSKRHASRAPRELRAADGRPRARSSTRSARSSTRRSPVAGSIVGISAEAGMGKSRLVAEFVRTAATARRSSSRSASASRTARTRATSSGARSGRRCSASTTACPRTSRCRRSRRSSRRSTRRSCRARRCSAALLDLPIPDNDLTASFDAKLRKTSLEGLLVECLRARASEAPLVLVLEDCHWLDPLSRDLLEVLGRALAGLQRAARARLPSEHGRRRRARHREPAALRRDRARRARRRSTRRS